MHHNLHIRDASIDDAASIASILRAIGDFPHVNAESHADTTRRIRTRIDNSISSHDQILVASVDGEICGYGAMRWLQNLLLNGIDGYLSELFIHPLHAGKNVGTSIIGEFRKEAKRRKAERIWCINLKNRESYRRGFYKKMGWEERNIAVFMEKQ